MATYQLTDKSNDDSDWDDFGDADAIEEEEEEEQRKRRRYELNPEGDSYEEVDEEAYG